MTDELHGCTPEDFEAARPKDLPYTGTIIVGTSGVGMSGLEEIFCNPEEYNFLPFSGVWVDETKHLRHTGGQS